MSEIAAPANRKGNRQLPPIENRFQKGKSGNPSGRPKRQPIAEAYLTLLSDPDEAMKLARGILVKAQKGDVLAAKEIADRTEGKAVQTVNIEGQISVSALLLAAHARLVGSSGNGAKR